MRKREVRDKKCVNCGAPAVNTFCGRRCVSEWRWKHGRVHGKCIVCGKGYWTATRMRRFCSAKCKSVGGCQRKRVKTCRRCGKKFTHGAKSTGYCSKICRHPVLGYIHPPCVTCGKPIRKHPREKLYGWQNRRCCNQKCAGLLRGRNSHKRNYDPPPELIARMAAEVRAAGLARMRLDEVTEMVERTWVYGDAV